jgi:glutamine amidotransferase
MCLIFRKPAGSEVDFQTFASAYRVNSDGFGLMYASKGRVHAIRGLYTLDESWDLYNQHKHRKLAVHFRYATHGAVNLGNCHPFQVLDKDQHGMDLYMMHNGVIQGLDHIPKNLSDTRVFVDHILRPKLLEYTGEAIFKAELRAALGKDLGKFNRLLFMDGRGRTSIVNWDAGVERAGTWFSNSYSITPGRDMWWRQAAGAA